MHPALGDSGGVHAAALHLLELRGALTCALARLLRFFSLARLLRRRGSRLLIGQGRLLYADVLSPLVSTLPPSPSERSTSSPSSRRSGLPHSPFYLLLQ